MHPYTQMNPFSAEKIFPLIPKFHKGSIITAVYVGFFLRSFCQHVSMAEALDP